MKDDYNSPILTTIYILYLECWGNVLFELGSERVNLHLVQLQFVQVPQENVPVLSSKKLPWSPKLMFKAWGAVYPGKLHHVTVTNKKCPPFAPSAVLRCGHCAALLLSWACACLLVVYLWSCLFKVLSESCIQLRILLITFLRDEGPVQSSRTRHFCWTQIEARGELIMTRGKKNRTNLNLNHYHIDSTLPLPSSKSTVQYIPPTFSRRRCWWSGIENL